VKYHQLTPEERYMLAALRNPPALGPQEAQKALRGLRQPRQTRGEAHDLGAAARGRDAGQCRALSENCWLKIKTFVRGRQPRAAPDLNKAVSAAIQTVTREDIDAWFTRCGY
jgi:hypothetical protein